MKAQFVAFSLASILMGCGGQNPLTSGRIVGGSTVQMAGADASGGFLPNPEMMAPGGSGRPDLVYRNPETPLSAYRSVLIDPVVIVSDAGSALDNVSPQQREALANSYYSQLYKALSQHCTLTSQPGPGVMRVRFALTNATSSNKAVKTVATYTPYVGAAYSAASILFNKGVGYFSGTANSEAYGTDAMTNTLLWEASDKRGGSMSLVSNTMNSWLDVERSFASWAGLLATRLKEDGVCRR